MDIFLATQWKALRKEIFSVLFLWAQRISTENCSQKHNFLYFLWTKSYSTEKNLPKSDNSCSILCSTNSKNKIKSTKIAPTRRGCAAPMKWNPELILSQEGGCLGCRIYCWSCCCCCNQITLQFLKRWMQMDGFHLFLKFLPQESATNKDALYSSFWGFLVRIKDRYIKLHWTEKPQLNFFFFSYYFSSIRKKISTEN